MSELSARIWRRDPTVWVTDPATPEVADRLGWLDAPEQMMRHVPALAALAEEVRGRFRRVILCGMGGSSLAPEVMWRTFGWREGWPELVLLDSTHPGALPDLSANSSDLLIIASKSGSTVETASFEAWAWEATGAAADRFVAITDPGSALATTAAERGYRAVFLNPPDIGGRYSALSLFGLVPAALLGVDVPSLLARGRAAALTCREGGTWERLGLDLATAARTGRDKLTLVLPPELATFGLWLEQLIAESTGKDGQGVLPVVSEPLGAPENYGTDRVFVQLVLGTADGETGPAVERLAAAGHPVHRVTCADTTDLGAQFFGWSYATAVLGHGLGVNPFDQPNVAEAKARTGELLRHAHGGRGEPDADGDDAIARVLDGVGPRDYVAVLAYAPPSPAGDERLGALAATLRRRVAPAAVTVGYGPRYLHSTGQLHKGGPPTGYFLQVVAPSEADVPIPDRAFTFGQLCRAQADGDRESLVARGRPVARARSIAAIEEAL